MFLCRNVSLGIFLYSVEYRCLEHVQKLEHWSSALLDFIWGFDVLNINRHARYFSSLSSYASLHSLSINFSI